jgi:sugar O-acyltransferase (sialic acid O-acetyltransferase NeuD family)
MADLIIFGAGDIAELAWFYFSQDTDHRVAAFTVDGAHLKESQFCGLPVVALEEATSRFVPREYRAFVALSYGKVNQLRQEKCAVMRAHGYDLVTYVSSRATTFSDLSVGWNCFILEDNTIQPRTRIGNNVTLWSGNHIGHHSTIEDNVFISSHVVVSGGVVVGANSFLGVNATLRDHIRIGQRSVIGAGSLILADTEEESVYTTPGAVKARIPSSRLRRI